jgi:hypothetical protein
VSSLAAAGEKGAAAVEVRFEPSPVGTAALTSEASGSTDSDSSTNSSSFRLRCPLSGYQRARLMEIRSQTRHEASVRLQPARRDLARPDPTFEAVIGETLGLGTLMSSSESLRSV